MAEYLQMKTLKHAKAKRKLFYGWIIVIAAMLIYSVAEIPILAFGIFVKPIEAESGWSREVITRAFGLYMLMVGIFSFVGGIVVDRRGPKFSNSLGGILIGLGLILCSQTNSVAIFYLGFSIMGGIGWAFMFVPNQTTVARWFIEKKGLALGLYFSGGGFGTLIASPLLQTGMERYGWRIVVSILAVLILGVTLAAAQFLKKEPGEIGLSPLGMNNTKPDESAAVSNVEQSGQLVEAYDFTVAKAVKTGTFWIYNVAITLMFLAFFMAQVNMVPHFTDKGLPAVAAALALGIGTAFSALGRILGGALSDMIGTKRSFYICLAVGAIMLLWLCYVRTSWMMYSFVIFFGLAYGGSIPLMSRLVSELFGLKSMGTILGVSMLISSLGPALGPVLGAASYVRYRDYSPAFLAGGAAILCAMILTHYLKVPRKAE